MNVIPMFTKTEQIIKKYSILFTLIVMYQGLFGGMSMKNTPAFINSFKDNVVFKYITLFCIAFTATQDIEISLLSVAAFVVLINLVRTPEERKKHKFYEI